MCGPGERPTLKRRVKRETFCVACIIKIMSETYVVCIQFYAHRVGMTSLQSHLLLMRVML